MVLTFFKRRGAAPFKYLLIFTVCYHVFGKNLTSPKIQNVKLYTGSLIRMFKKKKKSRVNLDNFKTNTVPSEFEEILNKVKKRKNEELNKILNKSVEDILKKIEVPKYKRPTMKEELLRDNFDTNRDVYNKDSREIKLKEILEEYSNEDED